MNSSSPILDSNNESSSDELLLDTDDDFSAFEDRSMCNSNQNNIGRVWRDIVVGEQMEGCLTRLEVSSKPDGYDDMDNPNFIPMNNSQKRKRYISKKFNHKAERRLSENGECDLESTHVLKKRYSFENGDFTKCNYKYVNSNKFVEKRKNMYNKTKCRMLPIISELEEKTNDEFLYELCTNLHEPNQILMLSVISKIDRKIILEKYNNTRLIEADGGQMIKNGNRRRTSGGIFFNLIKGDKSIPNSAKKDLFNNCQSNEAKKIKKREKIQRRKQKLKQMLSKSKEDDPKICNKEMKPELSDIVMKNEETSILI